MLNAQTSCAPLSLTRKIEDFPIGNILLREHQAVVLGDEDLGVNPQAWISATDFEAFLMSGCATMCGMGGVALVWKGATMDRDDVFVAEKSFGIRYPWDLIRANELYVGGLQENDIHGEVHSAAVVEGRVRIGSGTRILPGVYIEGNVVIGESCKIGPNCYIRGNTSIGDGCHIGQSVEIKNSLILSNTNVGHLSYVGDSVLGERVNLGAGTTVSNLRHDGKNHRSAVDGELIDTGRRKFGAIFGDGVHTGINTSVYPGRKMWPGTTTLPGEVVTKDVVI